MANKIAVLEEIEETKEGTIIIREKEDYFNKVYAVESKELKFFFDDDENENLMYAYCLQGNFNYPKSAELTFLYLKEIPASRVHPRCANAHNCLGLPLLGLR